MKSSAFVHNISFIKNSAGCAPEDSSQGLRGGGGGGLLPEAVVPEKPTPLEGQVQSLQKVPRTSPAKLWNKTEATECCGEEWVAMLSEAGIALTNLCTLLCLFASFPLPAMWESILMYTNHFLGSLWRLVVLFSKLVSENFFLKPTLPCALGRQFFPYHLCF